MSHGDTTCCRCRKEPAVRGPYPPMCEKCWKVRKAEDRMDEQIASKFNQAKTPIITETNE